MYIYKKFNFMALNPLVIASAIPAFGSVFSNLLGFKSQQKTNEQNIELAKYQNSWNEMMWRKNNQYNSPVAQMDRLKKAGLNPNLVYGNGSTTVVGNSSSPASGVAAPKLQAYTNFSNPFASSVETYSNLSLKKSQENLMKSQASAADASASLSLATAAAKILDTDIKKETKEILINSIIQDYNNKVSEGKLIDARTGNTYANTMHLEVANNLLAAQIDNFEANTDLLKEQKITESYKRYLLSAQARQAVATAILASANAAGVNLANKFNAETFDYRVQQVIAGVISADSKADVDKQRAEFEKTFGFAPGVDVWNAIIPVVGHFGQKFFDWLNE